MVIFNFSPHVGIGLIKFGMRRPEVRSALASPCKDFMKSKRSKAATDDFTSLHLHALYDENDSCNGVEFFRGADVVLRGQSSLTHAAERVVQALRSFDNGLVIEDSVVSSALLRVRLYARTLDDDPNEIVESVFVHPHA